MANATYEVQHGNKIRLGKGLEVSAATLRASAREATLVFSISSNDCRWGSWARLTIDTQRQLSSNSSDRYHAYLLPSTSKRLISLDI